MPKYNWTRVLFPSGKYGYVKTDNNDKATEYKSDGTFKVYSQPNEKSHSFYTSFETRPRTIQRVPDDHEAHLALQKQVDEKVRQVTPTAGQLFNVATVGGLNNLSPTQWMRRAYDTGQLIQGYMPLNEYMNKLYYGNNGIVSDEYASKHPYRAMAANLTGDIATFGAASALRKMPNWYRTMLAENQTVQNTVANNWRNVGISGKTVDMRNPENWMSHHWDIAQKKAYDAKNLAERQRLRDLHFKISDPEASDAVFSHATKYDTPDFNNFDLSRTGQNYPQSRRFGKNVAFFSEEYDPTGFAAQWPLWGSKYRLFKLGSKGSLRLRFPESEVIVDNPNQIKLADADAFDDAGNLIPLSQRDNFMVNDIRGEVHNTYNHPEQFIHPAEAVRSGKLYIRPIVERGSITTNEPLMDEPQKIIHPARGKFNPILESDIPELQNMLNTGQYREMIIPGSMRKVRMYFPNGNKLPIREDELLSLLSKYLSKRELSLQEKELAKQAPSIIKKLKLKGIDFTEDTWFQGRGSLGSNRPDAITQLDLDIYHSHMPEMEQLAKSLQLSGDLVEKTPGKWFGRIDGKMKKVDPADYIASRSKAFQDNGWYWDGINYRRAMTNEQFNDILNNGDFGKTTWTTDGKDQANIFLSEPPRSKLVLNLVGNVHKSLWKLRPSRFAKEKRELTSGVEYSPNVPYRGTTGNYLLFGQDVPVKSLRGNNLDYGKLYKGIYKMLIPAIIGGTYINNTNN